jgi:hypothetical protein
MAEVLSLVQRDDFTVDIDSVSLLAYTNGFEGAWRGWKMQTIPEASGRVIETIKLRAKGTSIDNLAANLQGMADKAWQTERYAPIDRYGVWLRAKLDGETNARQAFVYAMRHEQASSIFDQAMVSRFRINEYTLAVERSPYWEGTASTDFASGTTLTVMGGTLQYSGIPGDVPARMALVQVNTGATCGAFGNLHQGHYWIGFRSSRYGTPGSFNPYWDIRLGTKYEGGTLLAVANSRMGTVGAWGGAFSADGTAHILVNIDMAQVTNNVYDQNGHYLALLRAYVNAGTFSLNLRYGLNPTYKYMENPPVSIGWGGAGRWNFYSMGMVDFGGQAPYVVGGTVVDFSSNFMQIRGQRLSGTRSLYMDTIILIPLEGYCEYGDPDPGNRSNNGMTLYQGLQRPNETIEYAGKSESLLGAYANSLYTRGGCQMSGGIPPGSGVAVVVGESEDASDKDGKCQLTVRAIPRWKELRGAE